jgi:hypothetical protein
MNEKKHIDRFFQEKFKEFESEPPELVWKNIEAALKDKKQRRRIPIWFTAASVAAVLIIGALLYSVNASIDVNPDTQIVIESKTDSQSDIIRTSTQDAAVENDVVNEQIQTSTVIGKEFTGQTSTENQTSTDILHPKTRKSVKNSGDRSGNYSHSSTILAKKDSNQKNQNSPDKTADNKLPGSDAGENTKSLESGIAGIHDNLRNDKYQAGQPDEREIVKNGEKSSSNTQYMVDSKSDAIDNKLDSTAIANVEPNALEELLKGNEKEEKIAETNLNRWQITSSIAPIYFSSASKGSPIDDAFANNDKSFDKNLSIGLGINYNVNKKLSIRTGVNKFTLGYNTQDVVFFAGLNSNNFDNITPSANSADIIVMPENTRSGFAGFQTGISNINEGSISQQMGYVEVPLEMSYRLVDSKFGVSLIGGVSTLFLNENSVTVISQGMSASLGTANNLNDVHFSSNLGIGFDYTFWKSFRFNFEPMFKYQINTFTKGSGNFQPYFIGLYSGLSFKF